MKTIAIMLLIASLSACSSYGMGGGSSGNSGYPSDSNMQQNNPSDIYFGG